MNHTVDGAKTSSPKLPDSPSPHHADPLQAPVSDATMPTPVGGAWRHVFATIPLPVGTKLNLKLPGESIKDKAAMQTLEMPTAWGTSDMTTAWGTSMFRARKAPRNATLYARAIDLAIDLNTSGFATWNLWRLSSGELYDRNPWVCMRTWQETVMAGCHVSVKADGMMEIKGLIKAPDTRSLAPREVIARAIVDTAAEYGGYPVWEAAIRIMPQGWRDHDGRPIGENRASRRLFEEFGFAARGEANPFWYRGDYRDAHLLPSLEADGKTYHNLTLRSGPRTLRLAREFLASHGLDTGRT